MIWLIVLVLVVAVALVAWAEERKNQRWVDAMRDYSLASSRHWEEHDYLMGQGPQPWWWPDNTRPESENPNRKGEPS